MTSLVPITQQMDQQHRKKERGVTEDERFRGSRVDWWEAEISGMRAGTPTTTIDCKMYHHKRSGQLI